MRQMKRMAILALCAGLTAVAPAFAHGGKTHIMGTISALDAAQVTVKTQDGESVSVRLTGDTKYWNGDAPAEQKDLLVGSRVVVDLSGAGENAEATEVRFSSAGEAHSAGHSDHRH